MDDLNDTNLIFTKSNSDLNGKIINQMIDDYVNRNSRKSIGFISLGQLKYLSSLQYVDAVVGNSSSGIIEAPSFKIGTINIGDRQKGRIQASSIINCEPKKKSILKALKNLYSKKFSQTIKNCSNPYYNKHSSQKILNVIKKTNLKILIKKSFYNLNTL